MFITYNSYMSHTYIPYKSTYVTYMKVKHFIYVDIYATYVYHI